MSDTYAQLADLLEYPGEDWTVPLANAGSPGPFDEFVAEIRKFSLSDLQELYARTFDLNPVCALEIGYHLFGENYKRGEFLANLRATEAPFELGQANQLPDYLPVLLRLLAKLKDEEEELRSSLISDCMIPALDKILASLQTENPYRLLLEALRTTLQLEVPAVPVEAPRFKLRANLPVLGNDGDLLSGFAHLAAQDVFITR